MPMDRFLIAPLNTGLQTDLRPWLIPDDAFYMLNNAYVFRGRVRKRFGSTYMGQGTDLTSQALGSRLAIPVGTTDESGDVSGTVPGNVFAIGQGFSIGEYFYTVNELGTPGTLLRNDGEVGTATFDTTDGDFVIDDAPVLTTVYFYPATPVMGLTLYEITPINNQPSFAFDTQFAYSFMGGRWIRSNSGPTAPEWNGTDTNFFWTENWDGITPNAIVLFVSNFNATIGTPGLTDDPIWYYDGTIWAPYSSNTIVPYFPYTVFLGDGSFVFTARIIINFKNRLLLLNTIEQNASGVNTSYVNRCRFSHNGSPFSTVVVGGDTAPYAWLQPNQTYTVGGAVGKADGGGFIDATTEEAIVSAEFIKDRLIVYFERSTWELAYTGNEILPFVWQKINTELGSEAPNSTVPFDKVILTIGSTGVHACSGANVERIDTKIPDQIFEINTSNQQVQRVCGIRDYYVEMVYWAFPSINENPNDKYPNRVLVYNYRNNSWAFNDDCITAFGYFEQQSDVTWESATFTWETANMTWESGVLEAQSRQVIAGNQEGFVFLVQPDISYNAPVMQLTDMSNILPGSMPEVISPSGLYLTIINHTLQEGDYIYIQGSQEPILVPDADGELIYTFIFQIAQVISPDVVFINPAFLPVEDPGPPIEYEEYTGGAFIARVSQIDIYSKQWNPYVDKGRDVYLAKIDFNVLKTTNGAIAVDYFPSYSHLSMINEGTGTGTIMGTGILELYPYPVIPFEQVQTLLWHQVYFQTQGEAIQIRIYYNDAQMRNVPMAFSDFELEGMVLHTQATSSRLQ